MAFPDSPKEEALKEKKYSGKDVKILAAKNGYGLRSSNLAYILKLRGSKLMKGEN